jgi:hypothetical protein
LKSGADQAVASAGGLEIGVVSGLRNPVQPVAVVAGINLNLVARIPVAENSCCLASLQAARNLPARKPANSGGAICC